MSSLFPGMLTKVLTRTALALAFVGAASTSLAVEKFWRTDGVTSDWINGPWSLTNGGTLDQTWTSGDSAHFTVNSLVSPTAGVSAVFNTITVDDNANVAVAAGDDFNPFGTGGGVGTINVGAGGVLDMGESIRWDNTAGTALVKNGAGIFSLRGTAPSGLIVTPYDGGFTLNDGVVILRGNDSLGTGPLVINGGTIMATAGTRVVSNPTVAINANFTLGGTTTGVASGNGQANRVINFTSPSVNLGGGNRTITIGNDAANSISGVIENGALTIAATTSATGSLALTGANTYSGGTTLLSGILNVNAAGALGSGTVTLNGGTLGNSASIIEISNTVHVAADSKMIMSGGSSTGLTLKGALTGGPGVTLTFDNGGSGSTRFGGDLSGYLGKLKVLTGNSTVGGNNAIFEYDTTDLSQNEVEVASLGPNGGTDLAQQATRYLRFGVNQGDGGNSLLKVGALSGNGWINPNTGGSTGPYVEVNYEVGHLNLDSEFGGTIIRRGISTFTKVGTGSLTLSGPNYYDGTTVVSDGTLVAGANVSSSTLVLTPATMPAGDTITLAAHGLTAGDRVTFSGTAATGMSTTTNYVVVDAPTADTFRVALATAPETVVSAGGSGWTGLEVTQQSAFGSGAVPVQLGTGGASTNSVSLLAGTATTPSVIIERSVNVGNNAGGTTILGSTVDGNSVFAGAVALGKSVDITSASVGPNTVTFSGVISGNAGVTKIGAGSVTLSGLNTYTGNTVVEEGTLSITNNNTLANTANVLLSSGVLLDLDFTGSDTINSLFINGNLAAAGTWGSLASTAANKSALFDGLGMLNVLVGAAGQLGDFNNDGIVNLADYTVWRDNLGGPESALNGNGSGNATVGSEDYALWKSNFGAGSGSLQALGTATVPEPSSVAVLLALLGSVVAAYRIRVS